MTVKLSVEELESAKDKELDIDFSEIIDEINPNKEVEAELYAVSKGACIEISGNIKAEIILECDRCLKEFKTALDIDIHEVFLKENAFDYSHNEIELKNDNFVVELDGEDEIDITDLVYQSIVINIPNKKVCTVECEGLEELKQLKEQITDPRLAVFKDISKEIN